MVLKVVEKWVFWMGPGSKVNEYIGMIVSEGLL